MSTLVTTPVESPTHPGTALGETVVETDPRRPAVEPEVTPVPGITPAVGVGPREDHRLTRRRMARGGARVEVRRGDLGLGPNLAVGLVDVSEDGAGVRLKAEVAVGDPVTVGLGRPGGGKMLANKGVVRWCRPDAAGGFQVGLSLRRRLTHADLMDLAR